jgi:hypothetical protein
VFLVGEPNRPEYDAPVTDEEPVTLRNAVVALLIRVAGLVACTYTTVTTARGWWLAVFVLVDLWVALSVAGLLGSTYLMIRDRRPGRRKPASDR